MTININTLTSSLQYTYRVDICKKIRIEIFDMLLGKLVVSHINDSYSKLLISDLMSENKLHNKICEPIKIKWSEKYSENLEGG